MGDILDLSIKGALAAMEDGELTARDLTEAYINEMQAARGLNAFITETPDYALEQAEKADEARKNNSGGPLCGIPLAIKDLFCTRGVATTAASHILDGFIPTYESTVTANLWRDGAVLLGKTNLDEFAMGSSNETSHHGPVSNPWRADGDNHPRVPGGSSGGSAAAVAARMALGATGTDTGGSIRQPAAYTGTVGLKPSYGRCSRWGIIAFASSLDQAGPMTRTVEDAAILLRSMAGPDAKDSTCIDKPVPDYEAAIAEGVKGLRVGVPKEYRIDGMPREIDDLWNKGGEWLKAQGAELTEISLPHTKYALPTYYIVAPAEASSNLARYDGVRYGLREDGDNLIDMYEKTRAEGFGAEVKRRVMIGTYALSAGYYDAYYLKAQQVRTLIADEFKAAFRDIDIILAPTAPSDAFVIGEKSDDQIAMYLNDVFTVPASLAGLPALSVPAGLSDAGLPLGLQLIGRPFDEETVLRAGCALEEAAEFTARPDAWWKE